MLTKLKKKIKSDKNFRAYLLICLACLVSLASIVLFFETLFIGVNLAKSQLGPKKTQKITNKVLASSLPNFSLSGKAASCSMVIFSWQPVATLPVTIKAAEAQDVTRTVFTKNYDIGASLAIWPKARGNTNYHAALFASNQIVSNQITLTTPAC